MNGFTHFIGVIFSIVATLVLIIKSSDSQTLIGVLSLTVFSVSMILLFTASTLYHWLKLSEEGTKRLRKADHIMIFIYIAATYTPICIIVLRGNTGVILLFAVWLVAIMGVIIKLFWMNAPRWLSTFIYVLMGWLAVIVIYPLFNSLQLNALLWLFAGGFFYTTGAIIYAIKKPDPYPGLFGFHEIFHVFVLLGTISHFWLMYNYISFFK
ncbi:MAG TPA: hemolysin III family protein [Ignavibacteriaceae bacterium]|jgi:hemolysin III